MESSTGDVQQVLSIDQIRSIRANNDYVDRPTVSFMQTWSNPSLSQHAAKQEWPNDHLVFYNHQDLHRSQSHQHQSQHLTHDLSHSSTISSVSRSTTASDQRLLTGITPSNSRHSLMRTQPKDGDLKQDQFIKGLMEKSDRYMGHLFICEECGRCICDECTQVRKLPSCWICDQRCLCSAENVIEYGTCLCCIKGLFYHCSSDDEDNCADNPCSCSQGSCCARWAIMSVLSFFMPCLCCYPPMKSCLTLCQKGYDKVKRPGCRCENHTNTVCRKISSSSGTPFPRPFDKPGQQKPYQDPTCNPGMQCNLDQPSYESEAQNKNFITQRLQCYDQFWRYLCRLIFRWHLRLKFLLHRNLTGGVLWVFFCSDFSRLANFLVGTDNLLCSFPPSWTLLRNSVPFPSEKVPMAYK